MKPQRTKTLNNKRTVISGKKKGLGMQKKTQQKQR